MLTSLIGYNSLLIFCCFRDVETVLYILAWACLVKGVEAVVESWVSVLENHTSSIRGITNQERLEDEVFDILHKNAHMTYHLLYSVVLYRYMSQLMVQRWSTVLQLSKKL